MSNRTLKSGLKFSWVESLETRQLMSASAMMGPLQMSQGEDLPPVTVNLGHAGKSVAKNGPQSGTQLFAASEKSEKAGSRHSMHDEVAAGRGRSRRRGRGATGGFVDVSSNPLFGSGGPSADDIHQGAAADCYFLAALSETAQQDPGLIQQDIQQNSNGTYDVFFTRSDGSVADIQVNGQMPARNGHLTYAALGQGNDTWVAVMEKAFTYFRNPSAAGSYSSIDWGYPSEAFADIGAANIADYGGTETASGSDLGSYIYGDLQSGRGVVITTPSTSGVLVSNHVYSAVSAGTDDSGAMMIEVRNPWATDGPSGDGYQWVYADDLISQGVTVTMADV